MADTPSDLTELLARVTTGDVDAQDELAQRVYPKVRVIVHRELEQGFRQNHRWILPLFSTSDVVQEVLTDTIRGLRECDFPGEGAFVRYLATAVRNHLVSAVRYHEAGRRDNRRRADPSSTILEAGGPTTPTPEFAASLAERATIVRTVLESFPQRQRALLELRLFDGATFPEVADQLGYASAETARQAFCDAQAKLVLRLRAQGIRFSD